MDKILEIPVLERTELQKVKQGKEASCCSQPADGNSCCTPSQSAEENEGACCAQPKDGSTCCN